MPNPSEYCLQVKLTKWHLVHPRKTDQTMCSYSVGDRRTVERSVSDCDCHNCLRVLGWLASAYARKAGMSEERGLNTIAALVASDWHEERGNENEAKVLRLWYYWVISPLYPEF